MTKEIKITDSDIINGVRQIIRHLKLSITEGKDVFTFDRMRNRDYRSRRYSTRRKRRMIKIISENHGVLVGSRVLSKAYINGVKILENKPTSTSDWDFLITENNVFDITRHINFKQMKDDYITLSYRLTSGGMYSGNRNQSLDLILVDDLPMFYKIRGLNYACPIHIIETKIDFCVNKGNNNVNKHIEDLREIYWKFGYLVN